MTEDRPNTASTSTATDVPSGSRFLTSAAIALVGAVVVNELIRWVTTRATDVDSRFTPLSVAPVAMLTVIGVLAATGVAALVFRRATDPARSFRTIAAVALVVSLVPDVLVWSQHSMHGARAGTVLPLMSMHVVAAGFVVALLTRSPTASR